MIRPLFIFSLLIISFTRLSAQTPKLSQAALNTIGSCECGDLKGKSSSPNKRDAFSSWSEAKDVFSTFLKSFPQYEGKITVLLVTCLDNPARALACPDGRYVLYDNEELKKEDYKNILRKKDEPAKEIITSFDKFVLAHELGHHVRNHFHDGSVYNAETSERIKKSKKWLNVYNQDIIEELQADEVAIFLLKKLGGNKNEIAKIMESRHEPGTPTHPSSKERSDFIYRYWDEFDITQSFNNHSRKNFASEFHDKYNRTVYGLSAEVLAGYIVGLNNDFIKDNNPVNATLVSDFSSPSLTAGMRFSYINIHWPIRPEIETTYSKFKFITLDEKRISKVEDFNFEQINITPQATFNTLGLTRDDRTTIPRFGFTASIGYSVNIPLKYSYKNYYSDITALGTGNIKKTGNFTFAVGIERKPIRDEFVKYYRLSIKYSPMSLGIKGLSNVNTNSNVISANLSFRLWK